jgi:integrase
MLLAVLTEPCRTVASIAVLTGMRIGEILGLRWKRVDLLRDTIEMRRYFPAENSDHRRRKVIGV